MKKGLNFLRRTLMQRYDHSTKNTLQNYFQVFPKLHILGISGINFYEIKWIDI